MPVGQEGLTVQLQADPWGLCTAAAAPIKPLGLELLCREGFVGAGEAGGGLWEQEEEGGGGCVCQQDEEPGMGLWQGGRDPVFHHPTGWCHGRLCAVTSLESNLSHPTQGGPWPLVALEVEAPGAGVAPQLWAQGLGRAPWMVALLSEVGAVGLPTLLAGALAPWKGKPTVHGAHGCAWGSPGSSLPKG